MLENATTSTELHHDFCTGIGPLQLGVVLVSQFFYVTPDSWVISGFKKQIEATSDVLLFKSYEKITLGEMFV